MSQPYGTLNITLAFLLIDGDGQLTDGSNKKMETKAGDAVETSYSVMTAVTVKAWNTMMFVKRHQIDVFLQILKKCNDRYWSMFVYQHKMRLQVNPRVPLINKRETLVKIRAMGSLCALYINVILNTMKDIDEGLVTPSIHAMALHEGIAVLRRGLKEAHNWGRMLGFEDGIQHMYDLSCFAGITARPGEPNG
jgi:hypothetical protein